MVQHVFQCAPHCDRHVRPKTHNGAQDDKHLKLTVETIPIRVGPLYGLSLRDSALVILFFSLLGVTPAAYFATLGPRSGMRQMIQSRYAFGLYGNMLPVVLNAATVTGFCILNSILGGQTLAAVSDNKISWKCVPVIS